MKNEINPMQPQAAPRCGAKTRSGAPCQSRAVHGKKRCRMHGGTSPGAPRGNQHALKTGAYTTEALAQKREARTILKSLKGLLMKFEPEPGKMKD
ncbi:MAG TPA: HGGxSTG domain-containing protein [Telluria sp.]